MFFFYFCYTISNGQWKKLHGISCTFRVRKYLYVTTCRGRRHIMLAALQAAQRVAVANDDDDGCREKNDH